MEVLDLNIYQKRIANCSPFFIYSKLDFYSQIYILLKINNFYSKTNLISLGIIFFIHL